MYEQIRYEVRGAAALITLDRPEALNAWTTTMAREVRDAVGRAEADTNVVAIVLTGAGRGFCAGVDMERLVARTGAGGDPPVRPDEDGEARGFAYLMECDKPVVAAINGPVAGAAIALVLSCDLRFMADDAVVVTAFAHRGVVAEFGSSWLLGRLVGPAHALDLLFSSRRIEGREAERIGLVNRSLPPDLLMDHCLSYVGDLAERSSPSSMAVMKRQVYADLDLTLAEGLEEADRLTAESRVRPDSREGMASFVERRRPAFRRLPIDEPSP